MGHLIGSGYDDNAIVNDAWGLCQFCENSVGSILVPSRKVEKAAMRQHLLGLIFPILL